MEDLYTTLGVERNATPDEIKTAYRKAAQKAHPDKEGGSEEEFKKVSAAFDILGNAEKRKDYDETGSTGDNSPRSMAQRILASLVDFYIDGGLGKDPVVFMRRQLKQLQDARTEELKSLDKSAKKLAQVIEHTKPGKSQAILSLMQARQAALVAQVNVIRTQLETVVLAIDMLHGYEYTGAPEEQPRQSIYDELSRLVGNIDEEPLGSFMAKAGKKRYGSSYGPQR